MILKANAFVVLSACLILNSQLSLADTLKGKIQFTSKPPLAALVYIPSSKPSEHPMEIDQLDKAFTKKMLVVSPGEDINFKNSDTVNHNIFVNDLKYGAKFDVGLMPPGENKKIPVNWAENSIIRVGCKIHPKMRTYLANIKTEQYKIIEFEKDKQEYTFEIANLPNDTQKVIIKIPKYDTIEADISSQKPTSLPLLKRGKKRGHFYFDRISDE